MIVCTGRLRFLVHCTHALAAAAMLFTETHLCQRWSRKRIDTENGWNSVNGPCCCHDVFLGENFPARRTRTDDRKLCVILVHDIHRLHVDLIHYIGCKLENVKGRLSKLSP